MTAVILLVASAVLLAVSAIFGFDRQSTLELTATSYSIAAVVACLAGTAVYRRIANRNLSESDFNGAFSLPLQKRQRHVFHRLIRSVLAGAPVGILVLYLIQVSIPYLPGSLEVQYGRIAELDRLYGGGQRCIVAAQVLSDNGRNVNVCIESGLLFRRHLASSAMKRGDQVALTIVHSILGDAVVSVDPDNAASNQIP